MTKLVGMIAKLDFTQDDTIHFSGEDPLVIQECVPHFKMNLSRHQTAITDSAFSTYISLSDAITAFEEVAIE